MYGDGDLSLTSTPLVDERVPSTQAHADDLHPVSSMPPPPVPKRTFTAVQRSSVDSGVVAGGRLNSADSTRAGASLMGSTGNFGAEQGEQVGQSVVSDTHVATPLLWVRVVYNSSSHYTVRRVQRVELSEIEFYPPESKATKVPLPMHGTGALLSHRCMVQQHRMPDGSFACENPSTY